MLNIKVEVEVANPKLARALAALKQPKVRYALGALVVAIPAAAIASPLTVPNTYQAGEVISASEMNENFAVVTAAVDDNDTRVTAIESGWDLGSCNWAVSDTTSSATVTAVCTSGSRVVRGTCDTTEPTAQLKNFFSTTSTATLPMAGDPGNVASTFFRCIYADPPAATETHTARALCCPSRL